MVTDNFVDVTLYKTFILAQLPQLWLEFVNFVLTQQNTSASVKTITVLSEQCWDADAGHCSCRLFGREPWGCPTRRPLLINRSNRSIQLVFAKCWNGRCWERAAWIIRQVILIGCQSRKWSVRRWSGRKYGAKIWQWSDLISLSVLDVVRRRCCVFCDQCFRLIVLLVLCKERSWHFEHSQAE